MPEGATIAGDIVANLSGDHPEIYAGAAFTSDYGALELFVTDFEALAIRELSEALVASEARCYPVVLYPSMYSLDEYRSAIEMVSEVVPPDSDVWMVSYDLVDETIDVGAGRDVALYGEIDAAVESGLERLTLRFRSSVQMSIPIRVVASEVGGPVEEQTSRGMTSRLSTWVER